jgi:hypothetical protein
MEKTLPFWRSAILRQQLVQIAIAVTTLIGIKSDAINWDDTIGAVFAGIGGAVAIWTFITRLIKPAPNLTLMAVDKETELREKGKIPPDPIRTTTALRQHGRISLGLALVLAVVAAVGLFMLGGCTSTAIAYRTAQTLPDTAFVVAEHYAALVKQAADLAENPATPESVKAALQAADRAVKPIVLGDDETNRPGLRDLADRYRQARDAQTEAELQNAINSAVRELANFINAVKAARSQTHATITRDPRIDRPARRCLGLGAPGASEGIGRAVCVG